MLKHNFRLSKYIHKLNFYRQGRSANTIASGGHQRNFEMDVNIFRRNPLSKEFTQIISPGSPVQLGEELLLRASVKDGDGWKYSRMSTVAMQRILSSTQRYLNTQKSTTLRDSVILVDNLGCRVPAMKSVCPEQPKRISPLTISLPFRAFMFQGSNSGDEMVLSVRMQGCLQYDDCFQVSLI